MKDLADKAWAVYLQAIAKVPAVVVRPSIPILFFGDYERYSNSPVRIITVGLNPSQAEFPETDRFARFPEARYEDARPPTVRDYLRSLSDYFRVQPYDRWFRPAFESLLKGMNASYYDGAESAALHTDICSPIATDPTWSYLGSESVSLAAEGIVLWHHLTERLAPDVILISVAREHIDKLRFRHIGGWRKLCTVERENPYEVEALDLEITAGKRTMLVFGKAAQHPFGTVSSVDKRIIGAKVLKAFRDR